MPKFRLEDKKKLNAALTRLGVGAAFSNQAAFGRMLAGASRDLSISQVKCNTCLEVNEEGTEAAAVTSVGIISTSVLPVVLVGRSFLFLIREKSTGTILFIGRVTNP